MKRIACLAGLLVLEHTWCLAEMMCAFNIHQYYFTLNKSVKCPRSKIPPKNKFKFSSYKKFIEDKIKMAIHFHLSFSLISSFDSPNKALSLFTLF